MHRDKAALPYEGKSQLDRVFELAGRHLPKVFVSVRATQTSDPTRVNKPLIVDSVEGEGPQVGIRSAFAAHPGVAWLILACDLPFLTDAVLEHLLAERDPTAVATAFRSAHDGLPEPLAAIWEPRAAAALTDYAACGGHCPRKFLIRNAAKLIEPSDRSALDNINTPEEYSAAIAKLDPTRATPPLVKLTIQYFALLREQAGKSEETLETRAATPADLFLQLQARYGFTLSREQLKVAVNSEFAEWSYKLAAGDAVVFIPPVAGG